MDKDALYPIQAKAGLRFVIIAITSSWRLVIGLEAIRVFILPKSFVHRRLWALDSPEDRPGAAYVIILFHGIHLCSVRR